MLDISNQMSSPTRSPNEGNNDSFHFLLTPAESKSLTALYNTSAIDIDYLKNMSPVSNAKDECSSPVTIKMDSPMSCFNCYSTETSVWRKDADGNTVCNACRLYYKAHGTNRPPGMRKNKVRRRRRKENRTIKSNSFDRSRSKSQLEILIPENNASSSWDKFLQFNSGLLYPPSFETESVTSDYSEKSFVSAVSYQSNVNSPFIDSLFGSLGLDPEESEASRDLEPNSVMNYVNEQVHESISYLNKPKSLQSSIGSTSHLPIKPDDDICSMTSSAKDLLSAGTCKSSPQLGKGFLGFFSD